MSYKRFAYHYDQMMADVNYSWWIETMQQYVKKGCRVLDVGCGTGTLSFALARLGYAVTGLDVSEDMLVVASEKAKTQPVTTQFIHRDMRELAGLSGFDCVLIALDSLNYLESESEVKQTLSGVHTTLNPGGWLIFDVHTPFKMTETFKDYLYVENDDELTYIWHVEKGEEPLSVVHELTIFAKSENNHYTRTIEHHYQRTFEMTQYQEWLIEAGFEITAINGDEDRQLFVVRRVER